MGDSLTLLFPPSLGQIRAHARAEVLSQSLGSRLGRPVEVVVAPSYQTLEDRVLACDVDLAWAPPTICALVEPSARAIFKVVRRGLSSYYGALVCRAGEPPAFADGGLRAAWVDPLASAGHLLPLDYLRGEGLDPDAVFAAQEFLGSYQAALLAVLSGKADVTAIYCREPSNEAAARSLEENVGASAVHLCPVAFTKDAPSDGLIATDRVTEPIIDRLERAVDGSLGPTLLLELFDADRLERSGPGDYAALRRALRRSKSTSTSTREDG